MWGYLEKAWDEGSKLVGDGLDLVGMNSSRDRERAARERAAERERMERLRGSIPGMEPPEFGAPGPDGSQGKHLNPYELNLHDVDFSTIDPSEFQQLDPAMVSGLLQGYDPTLVPDSEMEGLRDTGGLQGIRNIAENGGLTAIDRARMAQSRSMEDQWLRGQRGATLSNMEARGLGGSGAEMASLFDQEQSGANRNAMRGLETDALALGRQDQAWRDLFSGESSIATATDSVNRDNAMLGTDAARYYADTMNRGAFDDTHAQRDAEGYNKDLFNNNLIESRDIGNQENAVNTGFANDEARAAHQLPWDQFNAEMQIANRVAGSHAGAAGTSEAATANSTAAARAGIGAVTGYYTAPSSGGNNSGSPYNNASYQPINTNYADDDEDK